MKKSLFIFFVVVTTLFTSCAGSSQGEKASEDSLVINTVAELEDPVQAQVTETLLGALELKDAEEVEALLNQVVSTLVGLVESGDKDALVSYAAEVRDFIVKNGEAMKSVGVDAEAIAALKELAEKAPSTFSGAVETAKKELKNSLEKEVKDAKSDVEENVNATVNQVKEDLNQKVDEAIKQAANKLLGK